MGGNWVVEDHEVAAVHRGDDSFTPGSRSVTAGPGEPGLVVGIEVPKNQRVGLGGEQGGK